MKNKSLLLNSVADIELIWDQYTDFGHTWFGCPNSRKVEKETKVLHKIKKLPSATLCTKLNIESEYIKTVNRTKSEVSMTS